MNLPKLKKIIISTTAILAVSATLVGCGNAASSNNKPTNTIEDASTSTNVTVDQQKYRDEGIENDVDEFDMLDNKRFTGQHVIMEVTGMQEFESVKSEGYEDIPSDGNVFVVFYMDLAKVDDTSIYFAPEFCEFNVDGVSTSTTILCNEPLEGYETIFGNLERSDKGLYYDKRGFMVIEAPKNWQKIDFTYTGWRFDGLGNIIPTMHFTRDDLHLPE